MVQTLVLNAQGKQDADEGEDNDCENDVFHGGLFPSVCSVDDMAIVCIQCNIQPRVDSKFLHSVLQILSVGLNSGFNSTKFVFLI